MEEMEDIEEYKIPQEAFERLKDPEIVRKQMKEGKTFQEIIGYSRTAMEKFYKVARNLFQKQEYNKAADAFVFLTTLNPYVHNYWLGLGMSEQLGRTYQGALLAYAMAILTDIGNPTAHYQSASCYRQLEDYDNSVQSYEMAIRCCGDSAQFKEMKVRAGAAIEAIENSRDKKCS